MNEYTTRLHDSNGFRHEFNIKAIDEQEAAEKSIEEMSNTASDYTMYSEGWDVVVAVVERGQPFIENTIFIVVTAALEIEFQGEEVEPEEVDNGTILNLIEVHKDGQV